MADTTNTAEIQVVVDANGVEAGLRQATTAAERAERQITGGANNSARSQGNLIAAIQRTTAQMESGGRAGSRYFEILAQQRGVNPQALEPYLRQLRAVEQAQNRAGQSAAQTRNAMQQLPAQMSDVLVSLQGGQNPLTVLLQQGSQVADSFGGVGSAIRSVGARVLGLINPVTLAAAAVAGLSYAYYAGSGEARAYNLAIATTGNAAGTSAALMAEAAAQTSKFIGSQSGAAEVLASMVATGQISSAAMVDLSVAAIKAQRDLGREVSTTVDEFAALGKDPAKALAGLAAKYHHVTAATYAQVKALQDEGRTVEAVTLAQKAHADGINSQSGRVVENLGYIESAWRGVSKGVSEAAGSVKDWFLSIGRSDTLADLTASAAKIQTTIDGMKADGDTWGVRKQQALLDVLNGEIAAMQKKLGLSQQEAEAEARRARADQLRIEITNGMDKLLSREDLKTRALAAARTKAAEAGLSEVETRNLLAITAKDYADVDEAAQKKREAAQKKREEAAKAAAEQLKKEAGLVAELAGYNADFAEKRERLNDAYAKGVITFAELGAAQAKLLAQQPVAKRAMEEEEKERKKAAEVAEQQTKAYLELVKARDSALDNLKAQRDENEQIGLTGTALADLVAMRLENQAALKDETAAILEKEDPTNQETQLYREQAQALRDLAVAKRDGAARQASADSAKQFAEDWKRSAEQIGQSLTDNIMRGGKSAAEYLRDLFRTLVLRPIIQPIGNAVGNFVNGAMGMPGAVQAGGAGLSSVTSAVSNLYGMATGGATLAGGLGTGFLGSLAGGLNGAGMGSGLTSALGMNIGNSIASVVGPNVASGIASGLSGLATAAPWVAGALAVYAIGKKAFGMGPKEVTRTSIDGTFGADGFVGNINDTWKQQGGWLRSDKGGVTQRAADAELIAALTAGYDAIKNSTSDYIKTLGINADWLMNRSQNLSVALTGDAAKDQQAIADFFAKISNEIAVEFVPSLTSFTKAGESASATLQRLATDYAMIDTALTSIGMAFNSVGVQSLEARERLIEASGGLEAFAANTAGFQQAFLTEAERNAPVLKSVTEQLAAMGLSSVDTREEFKSVVLGLDLTTEAGAKQYGALMKMQAAFAQVYPAIDQAAIEAKELADAQARANEIAGERRSLQDQLDELTMTAAQLLEKQRNALDESNRALFDQIQAVKAQKAAAEQVSEFWRAQVASVAQVTAEAERQRQAAVSQAMEAATAANRSWLDSMVSGIDRAKEAARAFRELNESLKIGDLSPLSREAQYGLAREQLLSASPENLSSAASAFLKVSKDRDEGSLAYARDFAMVQEMIEARAAGKDRDAQTLERVALYFRDQLFGMDGSHANGLDYVPFDGYRAVLHKGERVQTASEARGSDVAVVEAVNGMRRELNNALYAIAKHTMNTADRLDEAINGDKPLATKVVPA